MLFYYLNSLISSVKNKLSRERRTMQHIKNLYEKIGGIDIIFFGVTGTSLVWMTYREIADHLSVIPVELILLAVVDIMYGIVFFDLIREHSKDKKINL